MLLNEGVSAILDASCSLGVFHPKLIMDRGINIIPLNDTNYNTWRIQLKMYLMREGLLNLVEGVETAPDSSDASAVRNFKGRENRALANIVLNV